MIEEINRLGRKISVVKSRKQSNLEGFLALKQTIYFVTHFLLDYRVYFLFGWGSGLYERRMPFS